MIEYKCLELLNAASMKADSINSDGTFVFKDANVAKLFKLEAKRINIPYDEDSAVTEFKIENNDIIIYSSFNYAVSNISVRIDAGKHYCYYSKKDKKLIILVFDENKEPHSFYFSDEKNLGNKENIEYSLSNVVYWEKIYRLLYTKITEPPEGDKSISIISFEKGKCKISYSSYNPKLNNQDLKNTYEHLRQTLEVVDLYPMLFRNRCAERLSDSKTTSLENFILELDEICNKVRIDFEIFVNKIDFDSFIRQFTERIDGFIAQTRNIIEKMLSNIFTLPLTYAGAMFAFDKLNDATFSFFLFIAMGIYTLFSCCFLIYEIVDTKFIESNLKKAIISYTNNSPILLEKVENDKKSIERRLVLIRVISVILILIFITLLLYFYEFFNADSNALEKFFLVT